MWSFFRDGGMGMFPTALFGLLLVASCVWLVVRPERRFVAVTVALSVLTLVSGALGTTLGLATTFRHLHEVPDAEVSKIAALGCAESLNNAVLALAVCVLAAMLASAAAFRATSLRTAFADAS
jgi:hypothetical protein